MILLEDAWNISPCRTSSSHSSLLLQCFSLRLIKFEWYSVREDVSGEVIQGSVASKQGDGRSSLSSIPSLSLKTGLNVNSLQMNAKIGQTAWLFNLLPIAGNE